MLNAWKKHLAPSNIACKFGKHKNISEFYNNGIRFFHCCEKCQIQLYEHGFKYDRTPVKERLNKVNEYGNTILHNACFKGQYEIVKYLVSKGADIKRPGAEGLTPLEIAYSEGYKDIFTFLMKF
jgi:ankyrin repeat protein